MFFLFLLLLLPSSFFWAHKEANLLWFSSLFVMENTFLFRFLFFFNNKWRRRKSSIKIWNEFLCFFLFSVFRWGEGVRLRGLFGYYVKEDFLFMSFFFLCFFMFSSLKNRLHFFFKLKKIPQKFRQQTFDRMSCVVLCCCKKVWCKD